MDVPGDEMGYTPDARLLRVEWAQAQGAHDLIELGRRIETVSNRVEGRPTWPITFALTVLMAIVAAQATIIAALVAHS